MNILFRICIALSVGLVSGFIGGAIKVRLRKRYTQEQSAKMAKLWKLGSVVITWITSLMLMLGFIWCVYFLILGATDPSMTEYADNMSEMIVSVLTIVSIAFAFYEFLRRK